MFYRPSIILVICAFFVSSISAAETNLFYLASEPTVRIGLATNASSVSITTSDSSLVAVALDEPNKMLATNKIFVAPRTYRAPEIEFYKFEIQALESQTEAEAIAADIRESGEKAFAMLGASPNTWRVVIGDTKDTIEDANQYKADLAEKGFEDIVIITEKKTQPSDEAVALTEQLKTGGKCEVRSLIKPTGASDPTTNAPVDANLKEILVLGAVESAKF